MTKLLLAGLAITAGLSLPMGISSGESGLTLEFTDACAEDTLCTIKPSSYCNNVLGKVKLGGTD